MNRFSTATWLVALGGLQIAGCDGSQGRLIAEYRAADFTVSTSEITRSAVKLRAEYGLGHAYEVTSRRLEYATVPVDADPPIDDFGELVRPRYVSVQDPTLLDENGDPVPGRRVGGVLVTELPARVLGSGELYYRWVLEYTSGGDRLTMRKSEVFRAPSEREESLAEDERVSS